MSGDSKRPDPWQTGRWGPGWLRSAPGWGILQGSCTVSRSWPGLWHAARWGQWAVLAAADQTQAPEGCCAPSFCWVKFCVDWPAQGGPACSKGSGPPSPAPTCSSQDTYHAPPPPVQLACCRPQLRSAGVQGSSSKSNEELASLAASSLLQQYTRHSPSTAVLVKQLLGAQGIQVQ